MKLVNFSLKSSGSILVTKLPSCSCWFGLTENNVGHSVTNLCSVDLVNLMIKAPDSINICFLLCSRLNIFAALHQLQFSRLVHEQREGDRDERFGELTESIQRQEGRKGSKRQETSQYCAAKITALKLSLLCSQVSKCSWQLDSKYSGSPRPLTDVLF